MTMSLDRFPVGMKMDVSYPEFQVSLTLLSTTQLKFEIREGPFARAEVVDIDVLPLGNGLFAVSWQEKNGAAVASIQDHDRHLVHSFAALSSGELRRMTGTFTITRPSDVAGDEGARSQPVLNVANHQQTETRHG
ncbi:hypothetical protein H0E84_16415 [Luteimonas sp. SJ-92]|uniref:MoaF-like domain-containing protein n=1 Tax=Luteimonas salinisoli TaxID=2752307 RepID=A0A853JGT9_9GAMM|nr:hypothetical protein [Luteimonas salinisoli]NZA27964.1 hypothetical protein [Luteimonas salinisoli]